MKPRTIDYRARMAQSRAMQLNAARHNAPMVEHERKRILREELRRLQAKLDAVAPQLAERRRVLRDIVQHCDTLTQIEDEGAFFKALRASPYFARKADKDPLVALELDRTMAVIEASGLSLGGFESLVYTSVNVTKKAYPYVELANKLLEVLGSTFSLELPDGDQMETATKVFLGSRRIKYLAKIAQFRLALDKAEAQDLAELERAVGEARRAVSSFRMRHGLM